MPPWLPLRPRVLAFASVGKVPKTRTELLKQSAWWLTGVGAALVVISFVVGLMIGKRHGPGLSSTDFEWVAAGIVWSGLFVSGVVLVAAGALIRRLS